MDKRESELMKNTVILSLGMLLPKLVSTVTLPILTMCLTKAEYGTYDLIETLIMLLIPIATLQIQSAAFRFLIEHRGEETNSATIITNIFIVIVPISIIVSLIIFFVLSGLSIYTRLAIALLFLGDSINNASGQITRGLGGNLEYAISSVVTSVINAIGIVLAVFLMNMGLLGVMIAIDIAHLVAIIFLWIRKKIYRYIDLKLFSIKKIKEMFAYSWPMVPNNLSNWVLKLSDRLVITAFLGVEANAVYAVANKIPNLLSLAQSVLASAWQENASLAVKDPDAKNYYSKMFDEIFSLMIGVTAVLIALTPVFFSLLIKGDYENAYIQIPVLTLGMFFYAMSSFQGGIYIAHKKTRSVGLTTIVAAVLNLIIDLVLVNLIGITAGSLSTLIAYLALYLFRMFGVLRFQQIKYNIKKQIFCYGIIIFMLILCAQRMLVLDIINFIICMIVFFALNGTLIQSLLVSAKKNLKNRS